MSRTYSRSLSFKKPDGTEMWIRHEASMEIEPEETDADLNAIDKGIEEIVRKEVSASINDEKKKIIASMQPKLDEPFPGEAMSKDGVAKMPKLT